MTETDQRKNTRFGYKKSRNGCVRCKQRRVKCDEEVPCTACIRHKVPCSLEMSAAEQQRLAPAHSSPASVLSPGSLLLHPLGESDCWVSTAELMLHYTTVTYKTMVFSDNTVATFQEIMPREALAYPFFLRQILAFSAYHLAHLDPDKKQTYLLQASKHINSSLRGIREALSEEVTPKNCHALYGSTTFIVVNKFAAFPNCDDFRSHDCCSPVKSLMEIFSLVNGMEAVLKMPSAADLPNGPLKELFCETEQIHAISPLLSSLSERLPELARRISTDYMDDQCRATLTSAVQSITSCVNDSLGELNKASPPELRIIFWWPMTVSRDFIDLALSGNALSLVILAYYDILLHWGESQYWFFENWAELLITAIGDKVNGSSWEDLLTWPIEVILREGNMIDPEIR